jgi:hypothetical protein
MPIAQIQTPRDLLFSLSVEQLKSRIRDLNLAGHSLTITGNKPLLVNRIYYAENPNITPPTPTLPTTTTTAITTQTALASTVTVTNEPTKSHAVGVMSSLNVLAKEIRTANDPNKENWRAQVSGARKGLKDAVILENLHLTPVLEAIGIIQSHIARFELAQKQQRDLEQRQLEQSASSLARNALLDRVVDLYDEGRDDEAERLESTLDGGGIETATKAAIARAPVPKPVKVSGASTTFKWCWKLIALDKLKPGYAKVVPKVGEIDAAVKLHEGMAPRIVSVYEDHDAIEVWQEANTRSTGG